MSTLRDTLKGTGVAVITPFKENDDIDFEAYKNVINFLIEGKVDYLVVLGTTGEAPVLSRAEKMDIIKYTYDVVGDKLPVVVGIGGNNTAELLKDLQEFPLDDATAVLSASPYYSKPSQQGLFEHYKVLAENAPKPLLLYNVPARTGRNVEASTILRLAHEVGNIAGIKEAGGDFNQCIQVLKERPADFLVVSGDDNLVLPQIACGMDGLISVAGNGFPAEMSEMVRKCLAGDFAGGKAINDSMLAAYSLMFAENNPAGIKAFMAEKGLITNKLRLPLVTLSKMLQEQVKHLVKL